MLWSSFNCASRNSLRLGHERGAQIVVEPGKLGAIRIEQTYVASLQPIRKEILDQRARARGDRRTCAKLVAPAPPARAICREWPGRADVSSGMLLHKANDKREANSTSEMR